MPVYGMKAPFSKVTPIYCFLASGRGGGGETRITPNKLPIDMLIIEG